MSNQLSIKKSVIEIGIKEPIRFLHITDAHMDIVKEIGKAENVDYFEEAMKYAKKNDMFIVCTGDNFKWFSEENYNYAVKNFSDESNIFIPGNHDFCRSPDNDGLGEPREYQKYSKKWTPCYNLNIDFDSKIINGVNFVCLQNGYYSISYEQIELLKAEVMKGFPIILCMHVPLFNLERAEDMLLRGRPAGYMIAPVDECRIKYNESHAIAQKPTKETLDAVEYISNEPLIKAIVAGHIHEDFDGFADCGKRQITTDMICRGVARRIKVI